MAATTDPDVRGDVRAQIREFLTTRRARITPAQAGLPVFGADRRRVPGLRREEVAMLAGISREYYVRLERGDATGISEGVVDGIVHALQLDDAERATSSTCSAGGQQPRPDAAAPTSQRVRPTVQRLVDSMVGTPAFVLNGRLDVLASNELGRALYAPIYDEVTDLRTTPGSSSSTRSATSFFRDWDKAANDTVAMLRTEAGRDPYDRELSDLVGELSTRSDEFRVRWADAQRPPPRHRPQAHPPPDRRRPRPALRVAPARGRDHDQPGGLRRRARLRVVRRPGGPGQLVRVVAERGQAA